MQFLKSFDPASGFSDYWYTAPQLPDELSAPQAYANVSVARRAVDVIANAAQTLPSEIVRGEEVVTEEYILIDQAETINRIVTYSAVFGHWYALRRNIAGRIKLDILYPLSVNYIYERGELVGFRRTTQRGQEIYRPDDPAFIWWWEQNLEGEQGPGRSLLASALAEANLINGSNQFSIAWQRRGGPLKQLVAPGNAQPAELQKLTDWWRKATRGLRNLFDAIVLREGIQVLELGSDPKAGDTATITNGAEERLLATLGVPASMVFANAANYATAQQDARNLISYSAQPLGERAFIAPMNKKVFMPQGVKFEYRPHLSPAFQEANLQMSQAVMPMIQAGLITTQYAQTMLGLPITPRRVTVSTPRPTAPAEAQPANGATPLGQESGGLAVSDSATILNGAQISSAVEILGNVASGSLADFVAVQLLIALGIDEKRASQMVTESHSVTPPSEPTSKALAAWQRKSLNALERGKPASVPFASDTILATEHERISKALAECKTADDVRRVFSQREDVLSELVGELKRANNEYEAYKNGTN